MIVRENDGLANELLKEMWEEYKEDRSSQPSVTTLLDCLTKGFYTYQSSAPVDHSFKTKLYFLIGLGLEKVLLTKRKEQPTGGMFEGIYWHVDSIDGTLIELKSTRAKPGMDLNIRWLKQVMGYLKAVGQTSVDFAIIHIIQPDFKVYRLEFDQAEIDLNWEWLQLRKDRWNKAVAEGEAPESFKWNEEWECKDCALKVVCDMRATSGIRI